MIRKQSIHWLAVASCITWCATAPSAASGSGGSGADDAALGRGQARIVFEGSLPDWSLAAPAGAAESELGAATLPVSGKLVLRSERLLGGELFSVGEGLRLVRSTGDAVTLRDLVFSFDERGGNVFARSTDSRHLFTLSDIVLQAHEDGGALLVASMQLGTLAGDLEAPELQGFHMATVAIEVDSATVAQSPLRQQAYVPRPPPPPTTVAGGVPDVIVYDVGIDGGNSNDIHYWGQSGGIAAYSIATQSCNAGTEEVDWFTGGSTLHPVISQNIFRLKDGRFEHIGQSWLKHGFCAVNEIEVDCAPCSSTPCSTLGIGCADTYWATLNDGQGGGSKSRINAASGAHTHGAPVPSGNNTIRGRLQVAVTDIDPAQNPGAEYFIEGHYVTADDHQSGAASNNASWRRVVVQAVNNIDGGGATHREEPAIYAWKDEDPAVTILSVSNTGEFGGIKTNFFVGFRVTALPGNEWAYEYAIQNLTSDQSAGSFTVPVPASVTVTQIGFHDVDYHSGDPYDLTDWTSTRGGSDVSWATVPHATNINANALRWGTLYNFRFVANAPPTTDDGTLGLFKPGVNSQLTVAGLLVPDEAGPPQTSGGAGQFTGPFDGGNHAFSDMRNGVSANFPGFSESSPAIIGREWSGTVDLAGGFASLLIVGSGPTDGVFAKMGEVLVQPPVRQQLGSGSHTIRIPNDMSLAGTQLFTQAAVLGTDGWKLTNALDITIGTH